jgi:hypothetical protein
LISPDSSRSHLARDRTHRILFDAANASLEYAVRPPGGEGTFMLILSDVDGGGEWGEAAVFAVGSVAFTIPTAAFDDHPGPGTHTITFRAAHGAA